MADFTAGFETGTNGNTISAGDSGDATAWTSVTGTPTYSNAHPRVGSLGAAFTANTQHLTWNLSGSADQYGRAYIYTAANPSANSSIVFLDPGCYIFVGTDGKINIYDSGFGHSQSSTGSIMTGAQCLIEWHVVFSATVGQIEVKFDKSGGGTETVSSPASWNTNAAGAGNIRFGCDIGGSNWGATIYMDAIVANATTWPGPVPGAPQLFPREIALML